MKTSIATVCLSGTLVEKMYAAAEAGFDGVEVFEPDLVAAPQSAEEIRALSDRLGLTLDLYQPFRDAEGVDEEAFSEVLRRAEAKFGLMQRLGITTMLVCSNVATATRDDDAVSADQLRRLGDLAEPFGVRLAYEALAWGRYVDDYRRAWRIVQLADHPQVGVCLDSFHILSKGHDPAEIEAIPGEKIFFLQLADAPALSMDVLSWSRHHRLFPGEGDFDLPGFLAHVLRAGYVGPVSLEVFNDTFRQTNPVRTARQALRSLRWLDARANSGHRTAKLAGGSANASREALAPAGIDFVEVKAEDTTDIEVLLEQLGFEFHGRHRSKQVRLWTQGGARIVCNEQQARGWLPAVTAVGFDVLDPEAAAARAAALLAPAVARRTYAGEQELRAVSAPDSTEIFFAQGGRWVDEFVGGVPGPTDGNVTAVDHVNLVQGWQYYDEAVLFYRSVLSLQPQPVAEVASPGGLVRSQVVRSADGVVRLALNLLPAGQSTAAQHIAFSSHDVVALAETARSRGMQPLRVPGNYYDDLVARFGLPAKFVATLRSLGLFYDRDQAGEYLHFYTPTVGGVFFEVVERRGGYEGYGASNAPIRLASQFSASC